MKQIPAGVSRKNNKPYNSFVACSKMGCDGKPGQVPTPPSRPPKLDVNWDKISWGKCKHAYLVEAYKGVNIYGGDEDLEAIERRAEQFADMSMRKLGQPGIKDYGQGEEVDQIPYE